MNGAGLGFDKRKGRSGTSAGGGGVSGGSWEKSSSPLSGLGRSLGQNGGRLDASAVAFKRAVVPEAPEEPSDVSSSTAAPAAAKDGAAAAAASDATSVANGAAEQSTASS